MYKTMEQINKEYDGQWVFMINCKKNEYHSVIGGEVVLHGADRKTVVSKMPEARTKASNGIGLTSIRYAGKIPEGVSFL